VSYSIYERHLPIFLSFIGMHHQDASPLRITHHRDRPFRVIVTDFGDFPGIVGHVPGTGGHLQP
jgi:hypothetical protein